MRNLWNYLFNAFLNATKRNFKRMLSITSHHDAALNNEKSDLFIKTLYDRFHPLHLDFVDKYDKWSAIKGTSKGETSRLSLFLDSLVLKLRVWDVKVQNVFLEKTSDYIAIFPNGKGKFYTGTIEQRINELSALAKRLSNYPALDSLKTEVSDYYDLGNEELNIHQTEQSGVKTASIKLETARVVLCKMMYGNLGQLMDNFREDPEQIEHFFPLDLIRTKKKKKDNSLNNVYTLLLQAHETREAGISFGATTKFLVFNNGNAAIGIYTTNSKDALPLTPKFILQPDEEKECTASDFGEVDNRYMFIVNLNDVEETEVEISIL